MGREQGWAPDQRRGGGGPPRVGPPRRTIKAAAGGAQREAGAAGFTALPRAPPLRPLVTTVSLATARPAPLLVRHRHPLPG